MDKVMNQPQQGASLPQRFLVGVILALSLALLSFYLLMRPPAAELRTMATFLTVTGILSLLAGYTAYRLGWINRSPRIIWSFLGVYILSSVLTFFNVWVAAWFMFVSDHDLMLATVLLLFASGVAISLGYFLSAALTERIVALSRGLKQLDLEQLGVRVPVSGNDEMAELARAFNEMAIQLEAGTRKQHELDNLRRNLVAWVGHDLRTPLTSIRAILEALGDGVVEDHATTERYLRTAQRQIRSLSMLIDDLCEMAEIDAGGLQLELRRNSLSDLISDAVESFSQLAARQRVTLQTSVGPGVDPVTIDAQQIWRVLVNLISNALRHTPAGGSVQVRVATAVDGVVVEVSDTGEGIDAEDLPHLFERFYRGEKSRSRATGGAGLGLAIAKGIVEAHGGRIGGESTPGEGTRFFFTLPARAESRTTIT